MLNLFFSVWLDKIMPAVGLENIEMCMTDTGEKIFYFVYRKIKSYVYK